MSACEIEVDLDELRQVHRQLGEIQAALEDAKGIDVYDGAIGSGRVEDALDNFVGNWSQGRKQILAELEGLLERLGKAIESYEHNEQELAESMEQT